MEQWDLGDELGRGSKLADLRAQFEANRSNLSVLEEINEALKPDASDEGTGNESGTRTFNKTSRNRQ